MSALERAWYQKPSWVWLLAPLTALFYLISVLRRQLFQLGLFSSDKPNIPVIVVGNISVGGNGKTPLVIALCQWLLKNGYRPGVISRGYGGSNKVFPHLVTTQDSPSKVGDEPYLMSQRLDVPIVIDPLRSRGGKKLAEELKCDVIISDDGLQHYALKRDIEIVVVDGNRRHGNGFLLPMGPLREGVSRLNSVDFVVINGQTTSPKEVAMTLKPNALVNIKNTSHKINLGEVTGPVKALAGIGNPMRFFNTLLELGISVEETESFPDHHKFESADFSKHYAGKIIMTEKDAVKCEPFAQDNWWYLPVEAELPESFLNAILNQLKQ